MYKNLSNYLIKTNLKSESMKVKWFIRKNRCLIILFVGLFLSSVAMKATPQTTLITMDKTKTTIRAILNEIEKTTSYTFLYNDNVVDASKETISIDVKDRPLNEVLDEVFKNTNIVYTVEDKQIILSAKGKGSRATIAEAKQQGKTLTIRGKVTDDIGAEIIGASVVEKGTINGTMTDLDGKYEITVKEGSTIEFTYVGFKTKSVVVTNQTTIDIILEEDSYILGEVVTIGYGNARKQDLSMAISSVKIDETMKSRPSDINTILQGKLPGVTIQMSGGDPLSKPTVLIRGRGSRGNDEDPKSGDGVLFVVDGVPNAPYNVEDIENVTVLKDAASAAIYGASVGSGGVVIITTKQATAGKTKVSFNVSHSISKVQNLPKVLTSEEYNMVWKKASELAGTTLPQVANAELFPYGAVTRTDWLDEIFRTGHLQHYALSLTGGSESIKAFASFSYDRNNGTLLNTYSERAGAKLNVDFKVTNWLTFRQNATFQYTNGQGEVNATHQGPIMEAVFYPRSATVYEYNEDGSPVYNTDGSPMYGGTLPLWAQGNVSGYGTLRNPVAALNRLRKKTPAAKIFSTSTIEIKPISGLTVKSDFTAGLESKRFEEFSSKAPEYGRPLDENFRTVETDWDNNWLWETTATYSFNLFDKHDFSLMGGYTMRYNRYHNNQTWVYDWDKEDEHSGIFGPTGGKDPSKKPPLETINEDSMISLLGRISYSFDDRYFVTASIRRDGSSRLPVNKKYDVFPAFSGSWKISSEPFFSDFKSIVPLLKIRGSWGKVGNVESLSYYLPYQVYMGAPYQAIFGEDLRNERYGKYPDKMGNMDLIWETSEQTGFGLDFNLFNSLDITVDYFNKTTTDLIDFIPVPYEMFAERTYGNIGKVVNKGWEFSASYSKTIDKVSFNIYGNFSTIDNEVKNLGNRDFLEHEIVSNSMRPVRSAVGQPWYSFYTMKTDGLFRSQDEIDKYIYKNPETGAVQAIQPDAKPGDFRFVDINNDGKISNDDMDYMGSYLPKVTYAFGGQVSYLGFDFSFMFQGVGGNKIFNSFKQMGYQSKEENNMLADMLKSYDFDPNSSFPRLGIAPNSDSNGNYTNLSDFFLESGSYLRLKNMTLGYTLPQKIMSNVGLPGSSIRLYVSGENLFTITPYSGVDPEVGNWGVDRATYPVSRSFSLGLNLNF